MAVNYQTYNNAPSNYFQPQQYFTQPQGSSYLINSSLEISNIPIGSGLSVALCLSEGLMYLKTLQNGNPIMMAYKITPYTQEQASTQSAVTTPIPGIEELTEKIENLQRQINELKKMNGGKISEQL